MWEADQALVLGYSDKRFVILVSVQDDKGVRQLHGTVELDGPKLDDAPRKLYGTARIHVHITI